MRQFFLSVLATIVGIFGFVLLTALFALISILGMTLYGGQAPSIKHNSVMVINLQGEIKDRTEDNFLGQLTGNKISSIDLFQTINAIRKAKECDDIKGIYLETGVTISSIASYQELRQALVDFRKSGKWIIAYGDQMSQSAYYLCSAANKVYLNPEGMIDWHGLAAQPQYVKDLYAKFGVKMTVFKVGRFKSYTETFTEDKMSEANRQQVSRYLQGSWQTILNGVAASRHVSPDSLNAMADRTLMFASTEQLKQNHLIDGTCYHDEIKDIVKKQLGLKDKRKIPQLSVDDVNNAIDDNDEGDAVAVYYCQGSIVQISSSGPWGSSEEIVADNVCEDIEKMAEDKNIKAIVLRINSGGGDAFASEQIWHAVSQANKRKPVVVSMGGTAASGAYYMSMGARWIVAQPSTLTGSIGIFAAIPDLSGLFTQKLGIKFDEVKTNKNSTFSMMQMVPMARSFNATEQTLIQGYVNRGYQLFRQRVADGRKLPVAEVEKVAQGHVWLGQDALGLKLVDQLGGLSTAINKAAQLARLKTYHAQTYNQPTDWLEQLLSTADKGTYLDQQLRLTLGEYYEPFMLLHHLQDRELLQARIPFILNMNN